MRADRSSAIWASILVLTAWGLSSGPGAHSSGDAAVGGTKAYITSEFAVAMQLAIVTTLFYGFFISVAAGMTMIQDEEWRLGELLHATPLRPGEYIWAKFAAVLAGCLIILGIHLAAMAFFYHVLPNAEAHEIRGPFSRSELPEARAAFSRYRRSFFWRAFRLRSASGRAEPVLVFLLPVAIVLLDGFFLWEWSPSWLDPRIDYALMWIDPAGFRWLNETWLKVDRGVQFLQHGGDSARPRFSDQPGGLRRPGIAGRGSEPAVISRRRCAALNSRRASAASHRRAGEPIYAGRRQAGHRRWPRWA